MPLRSYSIIQLLIIRYQLEGVRCLLRNCITGISSGGILGDEMGLGKTVQAAVAVACCEESLPSIVITPKSLLLNWEAEIRKFIPASIMDVIVYSCYWLLI